MFNNKSKRFSRGTSGQAVDSYIGPQTRIEGQMQVCSGVRIDGHVQGNVIGAQAETTTVFVGSEGVVCGDVSAHRIVVAGRVTGNVHAHDRLELQSTGLIQGDVRYQALSVDHGGQIQGQLIKIVKEDTVA